MERQTPVHSYLVTTPGSHRRSGFTLVELLAVIMIIALLAGLLTPAVMRARNTARNASIKAEIDLLHMAIMNYKNEYGSFPPSRDFVGSVSADRVRKHLSRLFPRMTTTGTSDAYRNELGNGLNTVQSPYLVYVPSSGAPTPVLDVNNALYFWLAGYSDSPTNPFTGGPRKKLFDFDVSRLYSTGSTSGHYAPANLKESPYLYRDSGAYFVTTTGVPAAFLEFNPLTTEDKNGNGQLDPNEDQNNNLRLDGANGEDVDGDRVPDPGEDVNLDGKLNIGEPFNKDTFQIICAGKDGTLGTDDDLSNFWKGTRKEYLDSLK